ncbi:MAG: hypothetical protein SFV15_21905 [Polyangiaceae bacterium]|nr:hypothetical protein [Polyangiaceae bacterium]
MTYTEDRSKLKFEAPRSVVEIVGESLGVIGLVALVGVTIWAWQGGGSRITLLMFLAPGITLYAFISVIALFPRVWNFPVELTPENVTYQYQNTRSLVTWLKPVIVWGFTHMQWSATGGAGLGAAFLPLFVGSVVIILGIHIWRGCRV